MAQAAIVTIDYERLSDPSADLAKDIPQAYGPDGLGILTVAGVPGYTQLREQLLPLAEAFAALPSHIKQLYEDPESKWSFGWSHGREALSMGRADTHKGSYYANPTVDVPEAPDMECTSQYRSYYRPNVWPREHLPELEVALKALGRLIVEVGLQLASHCDRYVSHELRSSGQGSNTSISGPSCSPSNGNSSSCSPQPAPSPQRQHLTASLRASQCHKARLLHYFPSAADDADADDGPQDSWCGWHRDHGALTGLTSAMYVRNGTHVPSPDPAAGLYIQNRHGDIVQVAIPPTHLAFQIGQAMAIQSGGLLSATPHCVRGARGAAAAGVSRNTFAVFMQPEVTQQLEAPAGKRDAVLRSDSGRWRPGQSFGDFAETTLKGYYSGAGAEERQQQPVRVPMQVYVEHD